MTLDLDLEKGDAPEPVSDEAASAGRGVLSTMAAKAVFLGTGFAVQLALPRILADAEWGRYSTVAAITSIVTNTLVAATVQTVSKRSSEDEARAGVAHREGLLAGLLLAVLVGGGFALLGPWIAGTWQRDAAMAPLLGTGAVIVGCYAVYASLIGGINGRREWSRQAAFDTSFALMRSTGLVLGSLAAAALGAFSGWALAAVLVLGAAIALTGTGARGPLEPRRWLAFFLPVAVYQACLNGIFQIDQPLLHASLAELAIAAGDPDPASSAARVAGYYRAAQTFAFVPYQLILAVTFVVFPAVSRATSLGDEEASRRAIRGAMRFSLLVLLAMAAPIAGASDGVMRLVYREEFLAGAPALGVLSLGLVPFALFAIGAAILAGAGRVWTAVAIAASALVLVVGANVGLVRAAGPADAPLAAAIGTSAGAAVALGLVALTIRRWLGAFVSPLSVLRALAAAVVAWLVARAVPHGTAPLALLACACGAAAYAATLALSRELGPDDDALLRRVLRR